MKIKNTTRWRTSDLRRIFRAALKAEGLTEREAARYVDVAPGRRCVRGCATITGTWVRMTVRNPLPGETEMPADKLDRFAQVFVHEIGHNAGLRHEDMVDWYTIKVPWTVGMEVRVEEPKPKVKRNLQAERRAHAEKKLAEWQKKAERAKRLAKKWAGKVRYYERAAEKKAALKV